MLKLRMKPAKMSVNVSNIILCHIKRYKNESKLEIPLPTNTVLRQKKRKKKQLDVDKVSE